MSSKNLNILINRCITDREFRHLLLTCPLEVVEQYELETDEREFLLSVKADNLHEVVTKLYDAGLVKNPGRASPPKFD